MKKQSFIIFIVAVLSISNVILASSLLIDDFESYAGSEELASTYKPAGWQVDTILEPNDTYGKSMCIQYNSIDWGTYVTRTFLTPYNLTDYRGIFFYVKGDGSNNNIKLQIRENSLGNNSDGEAWEMQTGVPLSYQGYKGWFFSFSDLTVSTNTKKGGVLDLSSIKELTILVYKENSGSLSGKVYIDNLKFVPKTIDEIYPHNGATIQTPDKIQLFLSLKVNPLTYTNAVIISDDTAGTNLHGIFRYDYNENIITISNLPIQSNRSYKVQVLNSLELSGSEELSDPESGITIPALDSTEEYYFYTANTLRIDSNGGIVQDKTTGLIVEASYGVVSSFLNVVPYSGTELSSSSIYNTGLSISASAIYDNFKIKLYKRFFVYNNPDYTDKEIWLKYYNTDWNFLSSSLASGFVSAGAMKTGIYGISYEANSQANKQTVVDSIQLSSNPFTPNDDGKNDETKILFNLYKQAMINISIYDMKGNVVQDVVVDKSLSPGNYFFSWNGKGRGDQIVSPGFYIYTITTVYTEGGIQKQNIKRGVVSVLY